MFHMEHLYISIDFFICSMWNIECVIQVYIIINDLRFVYVVNKLSIFSIEVCRLF